MQDRRSHEHSISVQSGVCCSALGRMNNPGCWGEGTRNLSCGRFQVREKRKAACFHVQGCAVCFCF